MDFSEKKAAVQYKNRYGYIDRQKIMTNPKNSDEYAENLAPKFFNATDFKDGFATVIITPNDIFNSSRRVKIDLKGNIIEFLPHAKLVRKKHRRHNIIN